MTRVAIVAAGLTAIAVILRDAFEAIILPRRVTRRLRPTRFFYRSTWSVWSSLAVRMAPGGRRETYLSYFGPLSILVLISVWAVSLVFAFGLLQFGVGTTLPLDVRGFWTAVYLSGTTFFTLGLGDVAPAGPWARVITVAEGRRRLPLPCRGHLVSADPLPIVLAPRDGHHAARRARGVAAERGGAAPAPRRPSRRARRSPAPLGALVRGGARVCSTRARSSPSAFPARARGRRG